MKITSKPATRYSGGRAVYANGLHVGHIHAKSDHFRGRETHKRLMFVPVDGLPYRLPTMVEPGWTLRHMHHRIADEIRIRQAAGLLAATTGEEPS